LNNVGRSFNQHYPEVDDISDASQPANPSEPHSGDEGKMTEDLAGAEVGGTHEGSADEHHLGTNKRYYRLL